MSFALDQGVACQFREILLHHFNVLLLKKMVSAKSLVLLSPRRTSASMWPYNLYWVKMNPCFGAILISVNFSAVFFSVCREMSWRGTAKGSNGGSESRTKGHSATVSHRSAASPLGSPLLSCFSSSAGWGVDQLSPYHKPILTLAVRLAVPHL